MSLGRGTAFLLANQGTDGLWRDFLTPAGEASEWVTGYVGTALHLAAADGPALARSAGMLVATQNVDGGWGYNEGVPTDADSTAWVLLFLARMGHSESSCQQAASCLIQYQSAENGGVPTYRDPGPIRRYMRVGRWTRFDGWCRPHTEVTAVAGRALAGASPERAAAAWRYVRSQQRPDGSWSSYWWFSPHYATLQAVELAAEFGDREALNRAAAWVCRFPYHDAFTTALSLSVLAIAGETGKPIERALSRLTELQQEDGSWPSQPMFRIPLPGDRDPDRTSRRRIRLGKGFLVHDHHRTFTTATCVASLARVTQAR